VISLFLYKLPLEILVGEEMEQIQKGGGSGIARSSSARRSRNKLNVKLSRSREPSVEDLEAAGLLSRAEENEDYDTSLQSPSRVGSPGAPTIEETGLV
jgi:hypothetical protein